MSLEPGPTPVVLMLTDALDLADVAMLSRATPPQFSVQFGTDWDRLRGIVGTEAQLCRFRDLIDEAISQARLIRVGGQIA